MILMITRSANLPNDVSCLCLGVYEDTLMYAAVGMWSENSVCVMKVPCLEIIIKQVPDSGTFYYY